MAAALGAASFQAIPARALTEQSSATTQQKLPSFGPLVKGVKSAVVSIRVKADASGKLASDEDAPSEKSPFGNEQNPFEGTPFEKYFKGPNSPFKQFKGSPVVATATS